MITELLDSIGNINDEIITLLEYELKINEKKLKGKKLSDKEKFFDTYIVKPSTLVRVIYRKEINYDRIKTMQINNRKKCK